MQELRYEDYREFCNRMARKAQARLAMRGARVELDDLEQKAAMTFMKAKSLYDPSRGFTFATYLGRAILNELAWRNLPAVERNATMRHVSIEDETSGVSFNDLLTDESPHGFELLEAKELRQRRLGTLSEDARLVVHILEYPPPELVKEVERLRAFRQVCRDRGVAASNVKLGVTLICEVLGFSRSRRLMVVQDLERLARNSEI